MNVNVINKISLIFNYLATSDIFSPKKLSFSTPAPQAKRNKVTNAWPVCHEIR